MVLEVTNLAESMRLKFRAVQTEWVHKIRICGQLCGDLDISDQGTSPVKCYGNIRYRCVLGNAPDILILTQVFSITNKPKGEIVFALILQKKAVIIIKFDVQFF